MIQDPQLKILSFCQDKSSDSPLSGGQMRLHDGILASLPEAVLGGCTIMMFGNIVISGLMMIGNCGYSQRNIVIAALSLSVGLGFTQAPQMFAIFPDIVRSVFAENCVAVVFIAAVIMNLIMPKEGEVKTRMPLK